MPRKDFAQTAFDVAQQAIGEVAKSTPAVDGRVRSGIARAKSLSPDKRKAIASDAAKARWKAKQPLGVASPKTSANLPQKLKIIP